MQVELWTAGVCLETQGPGGWGLVLQAKSDGKVLNEEQICAGDPKTSKAQMELTAVVMGLWALEKRSQVTVKSSSRYVVNAFDKGWFEVWKTQLEGLVSRPNGHLWLALDGLLQEHDVVFEWLHRNELIDVCEQIATVRMEVNRR